MARHLRVAIDCHDPDRLAAFWATVLDYRLLVPPSGHASWSDYSSSVATAPGESWCMLFDPNGAGPTVLFHRVPEAKVGKNRVHLDVFVSRGADEEAKRQLVDAEAQRLIGLGASRLRTDEDEHDYYAVMQDPEGNEFCVC